MILVIIRSLLLSFPNQSNKKATFYIRVQDQWEEIVLNLMLDATIQISQQDLLDIPFRIFLCGQDTLDEYSPLVLLLHGAGGDHLHFRSVWPILVKAGYRTITVDLRYHGRSQAEQIDFTKTNVTFQDMQADLEQALQWYKQEHAPNNDAIKLIVGGLSMGSMLGQFCAKQWVSSLPQNGYQVHGFVGIGAPCIHLVWPRLEWMDLYRNATTFDPATIQATKQAIIKSAMHVDAQKETERAVKLVNDYILFQCLRACAESLPPIPTEQRKIPEFDICPMHLPQLLLHGETDEYTGKIMEQWQIMNTQIGIKSRFVTILDAGHMIPLDQGERVAEEIIKFF